MPTHPRSLSRRGTSLFALLLALAGGALGAIPGSIVANRTTVAPNLDGILNDACWRETAAIHDFSNVLRQGPPGEAMTAHLCFDDLNLYLAFVCGEPEPGKIRAASRDGADDVWTDDCVEVWIRTTGVVGDHDQFIVNTEGSRQTERIRGGTQAIVGTPIWNTKAAVGPTRWTVEMRIPFSALELDEIRKGQMLEIKFGREDHTGPRSVYTTWPAGTAYGHRGQMGKLYLGDPNLIPNADMSKREQDQVASWHFGKKDASLYRTVDHAGKNVIEVTNPGRYATASQSLQLEPETSYRLEAEAKGNTGIYVRARTTHKDRKGSVAHTFHTKPSEEYRRYGVAFRTGENGRALLIIGSSGSDPEGHVFLRSLRLMSDVSRRQVGPAIPVQTNTGAPVVITKLQVADCRAVRGFIGTPCDGTLNSYSWSASTWEYGMGGGGAGVGYDYNGNDGLHVRLEKDEAPQAIVIRGGIRAKLYTDADRLDGPGNGRLIWEFPGQATDSRALFEQPLVARKFSFYNVGDGIIGDLSFFRYRNGLGDLPEPEHYGLRGKAEASPMMTTRFGKEDRSAYLFAPGQETASPSLKLSRGQYVHFITPAFPEETPLAAVGINAIVAGINAPVGFTVRVQDPITPRLELCGPDMVLSGGGRMRVVLDGPDQIIPKGHSLWVSVAFQAPVTLEDATLELYRVSRERALPSALAHRLFLMKSVFICASEARRWATLNPETDLETFFREDQWGKQIKEVFATADHLAYLDPEHDLVRQYQWVYYRRKGWPKMPTTIDQIPGAPEWAVVARQAWLNARSVPEWWSDNRLAPSGEFGGVMNDDTDMYQNYVALPFFENDGVAAEMLAGARNLAELAQKNNLRHGLNKRSMDPLHAYEEGVNHDATMALWHYGDPVYLERCIVNARSTEALTVRLPDGGRLFKSQRLGAEDLEIDRPPDRDAHAHPLMWHPTFMVLWYNRNPRALAHVREWADTWMKHMEPGKFATGIDVKTGKTVNSDKTPFGGGYGGQASAFLFLYDLTGDETYVAPLLNEFEAGRSARRVNYYLPSLFHRLDMSRFAQHLPSILQGSDMARFLATGNRAPLMDALKRYVGEYQYFPIIYTSAEQFTDRIFLYGLYDPSNAYTGGFAARNSYWHTFAVGWAGFGTDYAALVTRAKPDHFRATAYSFAEEPVQGIATFWRLDHGVYRITTGPDRDGNDEMDHAIDSRELEIARGTTVPVTLPSKTQVVIEAKQVRKLDPIWDRADLAISPMEIRVQDGIVNGVAHNIGAKTARAIMALRDPGGRVVSRTDLGQLDAPLDLIPKRQPFTLKGLPEDHAGWTVVIDPDGAFDEIYEGNNVVPLTGK